MSFLSADLLDRLSAEAELADRSPDWPQSSWDALRSAGILAGAMPAEYGGRGRSTVEMVPAAEEIASACLTIAFILSQREAAIRLLLKGPLHLQERYLPGLAVDSHFLTVGLSQLTTSRQHHGPALLARQSADGFIFDGAIPWVTGADRAAAVVVGATLPDASQMLVVLPTNRPGVTIGPPMPLAALIGSRTCWIQCHAVVVEREWVLAGPSKQVLGTIGGGGLETSALALGLASAATKFLRREAVDRLSLAHSADRFETCLARARSRLYALAAEPQSEAVLALRVECTRLALRSTQTALLAAKGAGFVVPHPTQRWMRQAMFFLVWSCPRPVAEGVLEDLVPESPDTAVP